jgi:hypothetical protein
MHETHGKILSITGINPQLETIPQVFAAENFECVPVQIGDRYYWVVVDWMENHYANITDPNDTPDGTLDPLEVRLQTDTENIEDLLRILPQK